MQRNFLGAFLTSAKQMGVCIGRVVKPDNSSYLLNYLDTYGSVILMVNLPGEWMANEELIYTSSIQTAFSPGFT